MFVERTEKILENIQPTRQIAPVALAFLGDTVVLNHLERSERGLSADVEQITEKASRLLTGTLVEGESGLEFAPDEAIRYHLPLEKKSLQHLRPLVKAQAEIRRIPGTDRLTARVMKMAVQTAQRSAQMQLLIKTEFEPSFRRKFWQRQKRFEKPRLRIRISKGAWTCAEQAFVRLTVQTQKIWTMLFLSAAPDWVTA